MKKLSKIFVMLLTLVLIVVTAGLFTACDKGEDTTPTITVPTYEVTFHMNYHDGASAGEKDQTKIVKEGGTVSANSVTDPARPAGYTFAGWFTSADGTDNYDFATKITRDTDVYAHWSSNGKASDVTLNTTGVFTEEKVTIAYQKEIENQETHAVTYEYATKEVSTGVYLYTGNGATGGFVSNENKSFNFAERFNGIVADTSTYVVYSDSECKYIASSNNIVSLNNGNNYYYIRVTAEDTIATALYKINIKLEPKYTVSVEVIPGSGRYITDLYGKYSTATEPVTDGYNIGYSFQGWYYDSKYQRNEKGEIVDAHGNALIEENGVYYLVNSNREKYACYKDDLGNAAIREGDVYYKADKNGDYVYDGDEKIALSTEELYNVLDKNGLPTYETSIPKQLVSGLYTCEWNFDTTEVSDSVFIYGTWKANTYNITLNLGDDEAEFDGTMSTKVTYGIKADALGNLITGLGSAMPTHPYASFAGWYYGDIRMVNAQGIGESGWTIAGNATLIAKWSYDTFSANVSANNSAYGNVEASGASCAYGGNITLSATPNAGYKFVNWTIGSKIIGVTSTYEYTLDLSDLDSNNELDIVANFELISVNVTLDYNLAAGETLLVEDGFITSLTANYWDDITLPLMADKSPNNERVFDGWYYLDTDGVTKIMITDGNTLLEDYTTWAFSSDVTIYVLWNPNNYQISVYQALYNNVDMGNIDFGDHFGGITYDDLISAGSYYLLGKTVTKTFGTLFTFNTETVGDYYRFIGWYKMDDLTLVDPFVESNIHLLATAEQCTNGDFSYELGDSDVNLVAMWYYVDVNITINTVDLEGNIIDDMLVTVPFGKPYTLSLPVTENIPADHYFSGWYRGYRQYTDKLGTSINVISDTGVYTEYAGAITLTSGWTAINYFTVDNGVITGLSEEGIKKDTLTVPGDDEITAIASNAFKGNETLKNLTILGNIRTIGEGAFEDSSLLSVTFEGEFKGLTVETAAFADCTGLTSLTLPDNTVKIDAGALKGCSKLQNITYSADIVLGSLFSSENPYNSAWYGAVQDGVTYYLPNSLVTVTVSNTIDKICDYAFANCTKITTFNLAVENNDKPYTLAIGDYAFAGTSAITVNTGSVNTIGYFAFLNSGISAVDISDAANIKDGAFKNCTSLTAIDFSESSVDIISANCFEGCANLSSVIVGNVVEHIGASAFKDCTDLAFLGAANTDPTSIIKVGTYAFYNSGITDVAAANNFDNVISVGRYAYHGTAWFTSAANSVMIVGTVLYFDNDATSYSFTNNALITVIASGAFADSSVVTSTLDLSGMTSLKIIGSLAFSDATGLTSIKLPASLINIKADAFNGCSLQSLDLSACAELKDIGERSFYNCANLSTIVFFDTFADSNALADSVKLAVGSEAFRNCTSLIQIKLPDNLGSLGEYVFADCSALDNVNFIANTNFLKTADGEGSTDPIYTSSANLISTIPVGAFMNTALTDVNIPYFVTAIQAFAYKGCDSMTVLSGTTEATVEGDSDKVTLLKSIGAAAFMDATLLQSIDLAITFNKLGESAFENCTSLQNISTSLSVIPARAFYNCSAMTAATFSTACTVGESAFQGCYRLADLDIAASQVDAAAFKNCYMLTSMKISGAAYIGAEAFKNTSITSITIPSTVAEVRAGAFSECADLNSVTFEGNGALTVIGNLAFANCVSLTSISLPDSVTTIGVSAFASCYELTAVSVGAAIQNIGDEAFASCNNITVTFMGTTAPAIGDNLFANTASLIIRVKVGYMNTFLNNEDWKEYETKFVEYTVA